MRTIAEVGTAGPSPHLTWVELACHDAVRTPYPLRWRNTRAPKVGYVFEVIREACGDRAIFVSSGYRTREWNRIMPGGPGAKRGQHPEGRALDLRPPHHMHLLRFHEVIVDLAKDELGGIIGGIGLYAAGDLPFVHVDTRPTGRLIRWHGSRKDVV